MTEAEKMARTVWLMSNCVTRNRDHPVSELALAALQELWPNGGDMASEVTDLVFTFDPSFNPTTEHSALWLALVSDTAA